MITRKIYLWSVILTSLYPVTQGWITGTRTNTRRRTALLHPRGGAAASCDSQQSALVDAFAGLTQSSCQLLGIKSIGVDYGLVRTGIAKTAGYQPQPVEILSDLNASQVSQYVVRLAKLEDASRIVVGLPLHKNGTVAEQTNLTLDFAQVLKQASLRQLGDEVSVELWDERYTSKEAAARLRSRNPRQSLQGMLDAEAACLILEHYYNSNGMNAHIVQVEDALLRQACLEEYRGLREKEHATKQSHLNERERLMQRRKEAIQRDQQAAAATVSPANKKKRKKKRR